MTRRIAFVGYAPSAEEREFIAPDQALLREHLPLLLRKTDEILSNPVLFYSQPQGAFLSLAYIGGGPLPLGVLLLLWCQNNLQGSCPECGATVYVIGCGGSPLSGTHKWWGVCAECRQIRRGSGGEDFTGLWKPALDLLKQYPNQPIIQKGERARFSWSRGIIGEDRPDVVLQAAIQGLPLSKVICRLRLENNKGQNWQVRRAVLIPKKPLYRIHIYV